MSGFRFAARDFNSPPMMDMITKRTVARLNNSRAPLIQALSGARWKDRLPAAIAAMASMALTALFCVLLARADLSHPLLAAPLGASIVLLFAVPASPLAQPWPVIGGNIVSTLVGTAVIHLVANLWLAPPLAVGGAIMAMTLLRCLHPPGGALALGTALAGMAGPGAHFAFAFWHVGLNSAMLVFLAVLFHRFWGHSYPHRPPEAAAVHVTTDAPPLDRLGIDASDVDEALAAYGEALDVDAGDLHALFKDAELRATSHRHDPLTVADIMSRDVVSINAQASVAQVAELLFERGLMSLPVVDGEGRVEGVVTPLDLGREGARAQDIARDPLLASPSTPIGALIRPLSEGRRREVLVVDDALHLCGMVTQTDLIAALAASA